MVRVAYTALCSTVPHMLGSGSSADLQVCPSGIFPLPVQVASETLLSTLWDTHPLQQQQQLLDQLQVRGSVLDRAKEVVQRAVTALLAAAGAKRAYQPAPRRIECPEAAGGSKQGADSVIFAAMINKSSTQPHFPWTSCCQQTDLIGCLCDLW